MIDTVFGIKVKMSGLSINQYQPIVRRRLSAIALLAHLTIECTFLLTSNYIYYVKRIM